jgi:hypothetical protein
MDEENVQQQYGLQTFGRWQLQDIASLSEQIMVEESEYESLPTENLGVHMLAGGFAGIMEHCVMYPVDFVKVCLLSFVLLFCSRRTKEHLLCRGEDTYFQNRNRTCWFGFGKYER